MQIKTDGLTIRELNVGENDRIITLLTREKGVVRASARGARRVRSSMLPSAQLLCYSNFTLFRSRDKYIIDEAEPVEFFMGVRADLCRLTLAQYFAQVCAYCVPEEEPAGEALRLILNALHLLQGGKKPPALIKAAFEMRLLSISGFMPDLVACKGCGSYEEDVMYFFPRAGVLACPRCLDDPEFMRALPSRERCPLSKGALAAMRHTVYADFERLFSFTLPAPALGELARASERFLVTNMDRSFTALDFYHTLDGGA
jgi:DNA repair protein RecO (recombination protein O)